MKKTITYSLLIALGVLIGGVGIQWIRSSSSGKSPILEEKKVLYTCSMHPEILQDEPGNCPICGMDLIPLEENQNEMGSDFFHLSARALALADVQSEIIGVGRISTKESRYSGRIETTDAAIQTQSAYVSGRIEKLNIHTTGKMVHRGQVVGSIYSPELISTQQELISAYKRKDQNPRFYEAVHNKLKQWKWTDAQIEELVKSEKPQTHFPISAMVGGELIEKFVNEGSYVTQGQELFTIADLSRVWGVIDIPESEAHGFKEGDSVKLSTSSIKAINGKVDFIYPLVDSKTRTVQVRVEINNSNRMIKPGMLVQAHISSTASDRERITIPKSAVLWTGTRSVVYVVHREDGELAFEMREVEIGERQGDTYEITDGLQSGEEVVTQGAFTVDAAAQLQGKPSMMTRQTENEIHIDSENEEGLLKFMAFYFELKDTFVTSDADEISRVAEEAGAEIEEIKFSFEGHAQHVWNAVWEHWHHISHETDLTQQRLYFKQLNTHLIPLAKRLKDHEEIWYLQECPMADDDTGGYWISLEKKVINPYFGDQMLHCGSVEEVWN